MIERLKKNNMLKVFPEEQEIMDARSNMLNLLESRRQSINPLGDMLVNMGASMMSGDRNEMPLQSLGRGLKEGNAAFHASRQAQDSYLGKQMEIQDAVSNSIKAVREYEQKKQFQDRSLDLEERKLAQTRDIELAKMRQEKNKAFFENEAKDAANEISQAEYARNYLEPLKLGVRVLKDNPNLLNSLNSAWSTLTGAKKHEHAAATNAINIANTLHRQAHGDKGTELLIPKDATPAQVLQALTDFSHNIEQKVLKADAMQTLVKEHGFSISQAKNHINKRVKYNQENPDDPVDYLYSQPQKKKMTKDYAEGDQNAELFYGTDIGQQAKDNKKDLLADVASSLMLKNNEANPFNREKFNDSETQASLNQYRSLGNASSKADVSNLQQMMDQYDIEGNNESRKSILLRNERDIERAGGAYVGDYELGSPMMYLNADSSPVKGDRRLMQSAVDLVKTPALLSDLVQWGVNKAKGTPYEKRISESLGDYLYSLPGMEEYKPIHPVEENLASLANIPAFMKVTGSVGNALSKAGTAIGKAGKPLEWTGNFLKVATNPAYPVDLGLNLGSAIGGQATDNPAVSLGMSLVGGKIGSKAFESLIHKATRYGAFSKAELTKAAKRSIIDVMNDYKLPSLPADTLNQAAKIAEGASVSSMFGWKNNRIVNIRNQQQNMLKDLITKEGVDAEVAGKAAKEIIKDVRKAYLAPKSSAWDIMNAEIDQIAKDVPLTNTLNYFQEELAKLGGNKDAIQKLLTKPVGRFITDLFGKSANFEKGKYTTVVVDNQKMLVPTELVNKLSKKNGVFEVLEEIRTMPREHVKSVLDDFYTKYKTVLQQESGNRSTFKLGKALENANTDLHSSAEEALLKQKNGQKKVNEYRELRDEHYQYKQFEEKEVNSVFKNAKDDSDSEFFKFFVRNAERNGQFTQRIMETMDPKDIPSFRASFNKQLGFDPHQAGGDTHFNPVKFAKNYNKLSEEAKRTIYGDQKHVYDDLSRIIHNIQKAVGGYNLSNTWNVGNLIKTGTELATIGAAGFNFLQGKDIKNEAVAAGSSVLLGLLAYKFAGNPNLTKKFISLNQMANKTDYVKTYNQLLGVLDKELPSALKNAIKNEVFRNLPNTFTPVYQEKEQTEREKFEERYKSK